MKTIHAIVREIFAAIGLAATIVYLVAHHFGWRLH